MKSLNELTRAIILLIFQVSSNHIVQVKFIYTLNYLKIFFNV